MQLRLDKLPSASEATKPQESIDESAVEYLAEPPPLLPPSTHHTEAEHDSRVEQVKIAGKEKETASKKGTRTIECEFSSTEEESDEALVSDSSKINIETPFQSDVFRSPETFEFDSNIPRTSG
ncbi:hypothetical protein PR048_033692 [Dryococelus australis]|uniref:Uncharacterized protein n=1 Tax=Dryococelus australis TaxID=614101 RepID=A0ABQ9G105_9NEOP|nr:hypothetical protein PR048_033692 [Dryococelus australis]